MSEDLHAPPDDTDVIDFFGAGSPYLGHPLLTAERTAAEVDHVLTLAASSEPGRRLRILDLGCGPGRHSIELALRGHEVVGVDPSPDMIAAARQRWGAAADADGRVAFSRPTFLVGSIDDLDDAIDDAIDGNGGPFDVVIALFTTLGQVNRGRVNLDVVPAVGELLAEDGVAVFEVPNRATTVAALEPLTEIGADPAAGLNAPSTTIRRSYDRGRHIVTELFEVASGGDDPPARFRLRYHLFSVEELTALAVDAGFANVDVTDGYSGRPVTADTLTLVASCRRQ